MPGGRPRKPTAQKKLEGTFRKDRALANELAPPPGVPEPPKWLDKVARAEWARIVPQLTELGVLTRLDGQALEGYCVAYSNWVAAHLHVKKHGKRVKGPFGMEPNQNVKDEKDWSDKKRVLGADLGLNPTARSKVKAPERSPAKLAIEDTPIFGAGLRALPGGAGG